MYLPVPAPFGRKKRRPTDLPVCPRAAPSRRDAWPLRERAEQARAGAPELPGRAAGRSDRQNVVGNLVLEFLARRVAELDGELIPESQ